MGVSQPQGVTKELFRSFKPKDVTKAPNKFNKLDKKVYFLSNTVHLLNKKAIFMGKGRFIL